MFLTCFASVSAGSIVGYGVLTAVSAAASYAAWVLNDGRRYRCPRCRATVGRFARRCGRCQREMTPAAGTEKRKIRERQVLAAELAFLAVFAAGCLVIVLGSRPAPAPMSLVTMDPPPPGGQAQPRNPADDPWPIANEVSPSNASPQYRNWVEASKKGAVLEHPALGVAGSVFQTTFLARYHELSRERNRRLDDPRWPEELADEVALRLAAEKPRPAHP